MRLALAVFLTSVLPSHLAASGDDVDVEQELLTIGTAKGNIQTIDQQSKTAPPEQRSDLERQRREQVRVIVDTGGKAPKSPAVNLEAGKALVEVDEPGLGLPFADNAVRLAPKSPEARLLRGNARYKLGEYKAAAEDAKAALALDPNNGAARALLNFSRSRLADVAGKVKVPPKQAAAQAPGEAELPSEGGAPRRTERAGPQGGARPAGAPSALQGEAEANAQRIKAAELLRSAQAMLALGDPEAARKAAAKAAALAPALAEASAASAHAALEAGNLKAAREDADRSALLKESPANLSLRALVERAQGEEDAARADLRRAVELRRGAPAGGANPAEGTPWAPAVAELLARWSPSYDSALAQARPGSRPAPAAGLAPEAGTGRGRTAAFAGVAAASLLLAGAILLLRRRA